MYIRLLLLHSPIVQCLLPELFSRQIGEKKRKYLLISKRFDLENLKWPPFCHSLYFLVLENLKLCSNLMAWKVRQLWFHSWWFYSLELKTSTSSQIHSFKDRGMPFCMGITYKHVVRVAYFDTLNYDQE